MSVNTVDIPAFDPFCGFSNPVRALDGVINCNTITYDVDFGVPSRWIYIGTTGNLEYKKLDGTTVTLPNIAAGVFHPIWALAIMSANTTIAEDQILWGN